MASFFDYKALLESRRGHNFQYLTDELYMDLLAKGYRQELETGSECNAKEKVSELRKSGHFARIVCEANRLRIRKYLVFCKQRMILDPDADGDQWLYRGCFIQRQDFQNLLKYCCFDENWHTLGSTDYQKNARQIIDEHLKQRELQP